MKNNEKLRILRENNNLTQEQVAVILNISRSTYKDYELGISTIPIKHICTLAEYYKVSIDYILGLNNIIYSNLKSIDKITVGNRLKEFRKENKLTQAKLANALNTTFSTIAFYEKGRNLINTTFLYEICKKYNISADYLLGRIDNPKYLTKEN